MKKIENFIFGAMLGGLIGAGLAILLAPASGKSLRDEVKGYIDNTVSEVRNAGIQRRQELEIELTRLREPKSS
ncbi:MAG: YtxH domain-containing protein [Chloroflexi bacterium]|nr:YtxH domain-containing protein [Chloroflexota bacterium]